MHVLSTAALSTLSVRIIACAAIVSLLVQLVKWRFPSLIQGRTVMYVNVAGSVSATLAFMDPAHFWTLATLQQIAAIFLAAAGVHATVKGALAKAASPDAAPDFTPVQNVLGQAKTL